MFIISIYISLIAFIALQNSRLESGLELLDRLRKRPVSERSTLLDSKEMARVVYHFLKQRDVLLHDQAQTNHLK